MQGFAVPLHPEVQPTKLFPAAGVAVTVTVLPANRYSVQSEAPSPHWIPEGLVVMRPSVEFVAEMSGWCFVNQAVTVCLDELVTLVIVHVGLDPEQGPVHARKSEFGSHAVAVRRTVAP